MGKIILYFQISLDGIVSDPDKWATIDDELLEDSIARYDNLDAAVFGSKTYAGMAEYWQAAEKSSANELERTLAEKLNAMKKYVVSRGDVELGWTNSEQLKIADVESLRQQLSTLKTESEKDVAVESGTGLWRVFIQNDLFDEISVQTHPVIAGGGDKLFDGDETKALLELIGNRTFNSGVVQSIYAKK